MPKILINTMVFLLVIAVCGCRSHPAAYKKIVDASGNEIKSVCVVPLYKKIGGVSIGPDGKGGTSFPGFYIKKPFVFKSNGNFAAGILPSKRGIPLPPFISFGEGHYTVRLLVFKRGYHPLLLSQGNIYNDKTPIAMSGSTGMEHEQILAWLADYSNKQSELFKLFELTRPSYYSDIQAAKNLFIHVELDTADIQLLKSCAN